MTDRNQKPENPPAFPNMQSFKFRFADNSEEGITLKEYFDAKEFKSKHDARRAGEEGD